MAASEVPVSTAELLATFFAGAPLVHHPAIRPRLGRVRQHLETYLDTEAEQLLGGDELVLLDAQRQLDPVDAVLRVTGADLLIRALPGFCQVAWLLPDNADARVQLRLVIALRDWVAGELPAVDAKPLHDRVTMAVRAAQEILGRSPAPGARS